MSNVVSAVSSGVAKSSARPAWPWSMFIRANNTTSLRSQSSCLSSSFIFLRTKQKNIYEGNKKPPDPIISIISFSDTFFKNFLSGLFPPFYSSPINYFHYLLPGFINSFFFVSTPQCLYINENPLPKEKKNSTCTWNYPSLYSRPLPPFIQVSVSETAFFFFFLTHAFFFLIFYKPVKWNSSVFP